MQVIPLGTNGFFPSFGRATMCFAIPLGEILIILDAGSGLFRLAEPEGKKLISNVKEVHLFISHPHLDHTYGFYAISKLLNGKKVTVYGISSEKFYSELACGDFFPSEFIKNHKRINWQELREGKHRIKDYMVLVRRQYHNGYGSLAFRFDFGLAYLTDSEPVVESIEFISRVKLLLHEHYIAGDDIYGKVGLKLDKHFAFGHTTTVGAALIAEEANVGKLALIHHYPFYDGRKLARQLKLARSIFPNTILAEDLEAIKF